MDKNSRPDQIVLLKEWVDELSPKKVRKELVSCFKALNSIKRYKYYWIITTETHKRYLTFLLLLKKVLNTRKLKTDDVLGLQGGILPLTPKGSATLYYIFKLAQLKENELYEVGLKYSKIDCDKFHDEISDVDWYKIQETIEKINKSLKKAK